METLDIDPSALADVVGRMPGHARDAPGRWGVEPIAYRIINRGVTAGLYRVAGDAADDRGRPWSLVVKVLRRAANEPSLAFNASDDPAHWNYWRREALVYTSGLLGALLPFL